MHMISIYNFYKIATKDVIYIMSFFVLRVFLKILILKSDIMI